MRYLNKKPLLLLLSFPFLLMSCEMEKMDLLRGLVKSEWYIQRTGEDYRIRKFFFLDDQTGWALGDVELHFTDDGGSQWESLGLPEDAFSLNVFFSDPSLGWAHSFNTLYQTTDGGNTWSVVLNDAFWEEVTFLDAETSWALATTFEDEAIVLKTEDGWETWEEFEFPKLIWPLSMQFLDQQNGWIVGNEKQIFQTRDGGMNWVERTPQISEINNQTNFNEAFFLDENTGWILGGPNNLNAEGFLLKTTDGGQNWEYQRLGVRGFEIQFLDEQRGWIAGNEGGLGIILKTTDGGESWTKSSLLTEKGVGSMHVSEEESIWVSGFGGIIFHNKER